MIAPGAWADVLLVDGDLTADLALLADPDRNLRAIMKNGRLVKRPASPRPPIPSFRESP